jgi:hypothetical protein
MKKLENTVLFKCEEDQANHQDHLDYDDYDYDGHQDKHKDDKHFDEHCVADVLKAIHKAQKKVKKEDGCKTSCETSIKELFDDCKKPKKNTIPFILYCGDCDPFKATGVTKICHHSKEKKFACITSFIFKVKDIKGQCAVLELLAFKPDKHSKDLGKNCTPCSQIDCRDVDDLVTTGICINVDLSCFCAVTCLPAVRL